MKSLDSYILLIEVWAQERNISKNLVATPQAYKCLEEVTELMKAAIDFDVSSPGSREAVQAKKDLIDAVGDIFVTLIIVCQQRGFTMDQAVGHAWKQIKDRKGVTINGVFVKNES